MGKAEDESPIVQDRGGVGGNLGIVGGREKFSKALTMLICPLFPSLRPEINALYAASKHRAVTPVYTGRFINLVTKNSSPSPFFYSSSFLFPPLVFLANRCNHPLKLFFLLGGSLEKVSRESEGRRRENRGLRRGTMMF